MGKLQKSTKKFAASGRLKKVIKARHAQHKKHKKRPVRRRDKTQDKVKLHDEEEIAPRRKQTEEYSEDGDMESDLEGESEIAGDDESLASHDDLKDDGKAHVLELAQLARKDPEFYKYLQENDRDLLEFNDTTDISIITDGAKLIPYIIRSRKAVKQYLRKCLELWSSATDDIRLAAFVAMRMLASSSDEAILDSVLRGTYLTIVRSSKAATPHTLPSINLMKNSASDVFCLNHSIAYQHAFGFIRQLAIHLRNSMKIRTKDAHKEVYNWQFVHSVDFWSMVLARTCDLHLQTENGGKESALKPLIYPLVQVCLGAIRLVPTGRSHPFHLHIVRSLLHLIKHTHIYIPLSPHLVPIIMSTLTPPSRPKSSTLRPLDFNSHIRVPQQYAKTRILYEGLLEEASYLLAEWLATEAVHGSVAFPEIVVPILVQLRKSLKDAKSVQGSAKNQGVVKNLLERIEESARWVEGRRNNVTFAPGKTENVDEWERDLKTRVVDSPLSKFVRIQRKARENRQKLVEKAREGEDAIIETDSE